ncbi:DHHC palmitoyltransferase-domain-containing protein [Delphinella strobiligena]|nr:DHHC palmitoyltransferase-domain-containing protein [Delphinella strobiligena]
MLALRNAIIAVIVISSFTFIALFGRLPALRKTPIGLLQRILCIHIPSGFRRLDGKYTGGRLNRSISGLTHYLLYQKNPVVLLLFLFLLTGSATIFLRATHAKITSTQTLPIPLLLALPYLFTHLCVTKTADHITPQTHATHLHAYPYDHILYRPNILCRSCRLPKPARSKHCSLCGVCVSKADHHCPWVNNCLGRTNYRWFLLLLLSLSLLEYYGAYLAWRVLSPAFAKLNGEAGWTDKRYWSEWGLAFVDAVNTGGLSVAGVGLLAVTTAPLPLALLAYHVYLVWAGMTTNESSKWADWRDDMSDGFVYIAKRSVILEKEKERKAAARQNEQGHGEENGNSKTLLPRGESEDEPGCPWPVQSDQMIVRTTDGRPPVGQEDLWERVRGLDDVVNIYDLGLWQNLLRIMRGR